MTIKPRIHTTLGTVSTARPLRTRAKTDAGLIRAIERHFGPTNAHLCGGRTIAVEFWDPKIGKTRRIEVQ